jgi:hypothetical protein
MDFTNLINGFVTQLVPIIMAATELLKKYFPKVVKGEVCTVASLISGMLFGWLLGREQGLSLTWCLLKGFYAGGLTAGLWGTVSSIVKKIGSE